MHVVRKMASHLLTGAVACSLLAACHGGSTTTASTTPPVAGTFACVGVTNTTTIAGIAVTCTSTGASDADGSTPSYSWSFGDQTPSTSTQTLTGSPVTHVYSQPGSYTVDLTVTDDHGTTSSRVETITVIGTPATVAGNESWAWIRGAKFANSPGDFETQFTPTATNQPSARQSASSWTSQQGKLWLFGGSGYDSTGTIGDLNDLWMYDPALSEWTWVSGSNKANAIGIYPTAPGANAIAATNVIGARSAAAQWVDTSGNFWIFGGNGYDSAGAVGYLNDTWMLNPQTGEATWEAGASTVNNAGAGTASSAGATSTTNSPSARAYATTWVDQNGIFWLFGGQNTNSAGTTVMLDDLWSYDPNPADTNNHPNGKKGWMLISGSPATNNVKGTYGTLNTGVAGNYPGSRVSAQGWTDAAGNLWMFGGSGYDSADSFGTLNDLWSFNPKTLVWTWVTGANTIGAAGIYGSRGSTVPATAGTPNTPGARLGTTGWIDSTGNLWMFGGSGSDSTGTAVTSDGGGALNELWMFNTTSKLWAWMGGINIAGTAGVYGTTNLPPGASSANNSPGSRVWGIGWNGAANAAGNNTFWLFGGSGLDSVGTSGYLNDLWQVQLTIQPTN
jgi:N-acetylneuraminic acid mutarotase